MATDRNSGRMGSQTFQGRPVAGLYWKDKEVEAVQGALVYRTTSTRKISIMEVESALMVRIQEVIQPDDLGIGIIYTDESLKAEQIISAAVRMGPDVIWTEPVLLDRGALIPNDTLFPQQWNLADIKASSAWDIWNGDPSKVVLAVLDSGIPIENGNLSHQDLNDTSRFFVGDDVYNHDNNPSDDHGHGTHVTGIAAATTNNGTGIAGLWPGPMLALKVFNAHNAGANTTFYDGVKAAVRFAGERRAHLIINYSGGGPDSRTKKLAIELANDKGALIVAAVGNENGGGIVFPAAYSIHYSNVMAIGAVDHQHQRPGFASKGPEMTVVAPGVDIVSSLPNYFVTLNDEGKKLNNDLLDGTSQATPLAAGLAALVWSKWPQLSAVQVRDKIIQSADPIPGSFNEYGHGLINAEAALT
jgi:thermitase